MSPKEIRALRDNHPGWTPEMAQAIMLQEIAAQLAELNAKLADGSSPIAVALCASNDTIPVSLDVDRIDFNRIGRSLRA